MEEATVTERYPTSEETRQRQRRRRLRSKETRALIDERRAQAWAEVQSRPADWTCPDGKPYENPGPVWSEHPCGDWCVEGCCRGNAHRVVGIWSPDANNTAWRFAPTGRPGEGEERRVRRHLDSLPPVIRRRIRDSALLAAWEADKGAPLASIYCAAQRADGSRCERRVASLYLQGRTYILGDSEHYTFAESRVGNLSAAMQARDAGFEMDATLFSAAADVKVWRLVHTLDPLPAGDPLAGSRAGMAFDYLLIGCRSHGNVAASRAWLRKIARSRRHVDVDPQLQRWYVLRSEVPPAEA